MNDPRLEEVKVLVFREAVGVIGKKPLSLLPMKCEKNEDNSTLWT